MAIPTLYKWDDAGAPQLKRQAQSLLTILRKCLVEGYGSKAALGWSIAFDDAVNLRTVYRNASGKGEIRFAPASTPTGDNVAFLAAASFSDIDTALAPGLSDLALTYFSPYEFNRWEVVGTGDAIYLLVWSSTLTESNSYLSARHQTYFFGNMISPISDDPYPFIATGRRSPSEVNTSLPTVGLGALLSTMSNDNAEYSATKLSISTYISGGINGAISRRPVNFLMCLRMDTVDNVSKLWQLTLPILVPPLPLLLTELATASSPPLDKSANPQIRGQLPGIIRVCVWLQSTHGSLIDVGGVPHIAIQSTMSHGCCLLISLGDWQS